MLYEKNEQNDIFNAYFVLNSTLTESYLSRLDRIMNPIFQNVDVIFFDANKQNKINKLNHIYFYK